MFAISRSLLACHFCFFYLVVFPLNAVHLTFQGHHRYSDEECWTPEWVCVLLSSVYCILSWSFYSSSYLTICVYVPTLQISELLKLLIVVYMLFLLSYSLTLSNHSRGFLYDFVYTKMRQQSEKSSCFFECLQNILSIQCSIFVHFWM